MAYVGTVFGPRAIRGKLPQMQLNGSSPSYGRWLSSFASFTAGQRSSKDDAGPEIINRDEIGSSCRRPIHTAVVVQEVCTCRLLRYM